MNAKKKKKGPKPKEEDQKEEREDLFNNCSLEERAYRMLLAHNVKMEKMC